MIVPSTAGGITDFVGRLARPTTSPARPARPVIVENRPGAGGAVGMEAVAKAAPDGYTLAPSIPAISSAGSCTPALSFDPFKDLLPVAMFAEAPQLAGRGRPRSRQDVPGVSRLTRGPAPGKINYGSAGTGSLTQIGAEQLARLAGLQLVHVPYRGAIPAVTDMIAGRVQMMHISLNPTYRAHQGRDAAAARRDREGSLADYLPDVPTTAEVGPAGLRDGHLVWPGRAARDAEADRGTDQRLHARDGGRSGHAEAYSSTVSCGRSRKARTSSRPFWRRMRRAGKRSIRELGAQAE